MTPLASGLLLLAIALVIAAYVVACDRADRDPKDGPWMVVAVLLTAPWGVAAAPRSMAASAATVAPRESAAAQGVGPGLPWLASRVAAGRTKGQGAESPALTRAPAGVPGGSGSRGAAPFYADPANGGSQEGDLAMIAGCRLSRGASVEGRG